MDGLLSLLVKSFSSFLFSQQVSGIVVDEDQNPLPGVLVLNWRTEQKSVSNLKGEFIIEPKANDELRFVKKGFERNLKKVKTQDFDDILRSELTRAVAEIQPFIYYISEILKGKKFYFVVVASHIMFRDLSPNPTKN